MNSSQAYQILGLDPGSSKDELKSKFRKLAAQYHPDRNKDPGAEDKFKEINSAYQLLEKGETSSDSVFGSGINIDLTNFTNFPFSNPFFGFKNHVVPVIKINLTFVESVLGCEKEFTFLQNDKCGECQGSGKKVIGKCTYCNGSGGSESAFRRVGANVRFFNMCRHCKGTGGTSEQCGLCLGKCTQEKETSRKVKLPFGLQNGERIKISGAGDFISKTNGGDIYSDILLDITVEPEPNMILSEHNVISTLEVSLLEALKGTTKTVKTVRGEIILKIKSGLKNGDTIRLAKYGAGSIGDHLFNLNVKYPEDTKGLIEFLEKEKES